MKRFLLKIVLFVSIVFVLDRAAGLFFSYLGDHAKGGYIAHHNYVTNTTTEDILIFGSSRAIHHYNPEILSDSLGMTCYNCGQDGNGIILFYGVWQMIKERYRPKMIIYDVNADFDLYVREANQRYLGWLRADYDRAGIKDIFATVDSEERYKMMSKFYRYNTKFLQYIVDYVHPLFHIEKNGYLPLEGKMDKMKVRDEDTIDTGTLQVLDELKIRFINSLIEETEGIRLVFVASPTWYECNESLYRPIKDICERRNVPFVDFSHDARFTHQDEYFKDGTHLNAYGADVFTRNLTDSLRRITSF